MTIEPIGKRIASYRKARGFKTAAALAEAIPNDAVSASVIQNIESGRKVDVTVAQLLDIAWAMRVSPAHLIVPVHTPMEKFQYPGVGTDVADMSVNDALAWITTRKNDDGMTNPTENFIRNVAHYTDVLRSSIDDFKFAAAAAEKHEPVEEIVNEDPETGRTYTEVHNPNEANWYAASYHAGRGSTAYEWLERLQNYDLSWATQPWEGTPYLGTRETRDSAQENENHG